MNALTPTNANPTTSPTISQPLSALLNAEPSSERAVREIATNPVLKAEVERALPMLTDHAKRPAGEAGVARVVGPRLVLFPVNLPPASMEAWWADYYDALADLNEGALEAGMRAHIKGGGQFMPKPGELRQLALTTENRAVRALERAKAAIEYQPPKIYDTMPMPEITPRILHDEPTAEQKAWARQQAADFAARIEAQKKPAENPFKVKAKVDGGGLTEAMREAIARRAEQEGEA